MLMDIDDNNLGLYDFRWGEPPPFPAVKNGSFYEEPCSNQLVYDDTPDNDYYNGTFVAKFREDVADGTYFIRWFNGNGPLPDDYYEVQLKRDPAISCEAMGYQKDESDMCRHEGCEWEDTWKKPTGC